MNTDAKFSFGTQYVRYFVVLFLFSILSRFTRAYTIH